VGVDLGDKWSNFCIVGLDGVVAGCGHEVLVANPRQMEGPKPRKRKNDRI
jgi:hypothetical protein